MDERDENVRASAHVVPGGVGGAGKEDDSARAPGALDHGWLARLAWLGRGESEDRARPADLDAFGILRGLRPLLLVERRGQVEHPVEVDVERAGTGRIVPELGDRVLEILILQQRELVV